MIKVRAFAGILDTFVGFNFWKWSWLWPNSGKKVYFSVSWLYINIMTWGFYFDIYSQCFSKRDQAQGLVKHHYILSFFTNISMENLFLCIKLFQFKNLNFVPYTFLDIFREFYVMYNIGFINYVPVKQPYTPHILRYWQTWLFYPVTIIKLKSTTDLIQNTDKV